MNKPLLTRRAVLALAASLLLAGPATADDWPRFRGENGQGIATGPAPPLTWSDSENLAWKLDLPGAGASSPIVLGERVFVTCYSGYGVPGEEGSMDALVRHLVCADRATGKELWRQSVPADGAEDSYEGFITEHGYASNTPVADESGVYVQHGKSGVYAYSLGGEPMWHVAVGKQSGPEGWGTAASLQLYKDSLIVNAADEGRAILALDPANGEERWRFEDPALEKAYNTPVIATTDAGEEELVVVCVGKTLGIDPDKGEQKWSVANEFSNNISPMAIAVEDKLFVTGGYRGSGMMLRPGGHGDASDTHTVWRTRELSYVATPVLLPGGRLFWVDTKGMLVVIDAETGERLVRDRLDLGGGHPVYASPVLAGDRIYVASRHDGVLVFNTAEEPELIAQNSFESDDSQVNATVAIADGQIFLRSDAALYCVGDRN
ncbi:outer membrane biogenesis protein BamB [Pseudobythopirellula maris]|uniref:Outer membrane biogenesis protein BamB n=1 Tax=Pseudobythopirellula maris TaxID=2527991 RepID=A0A5C5ZJ87_9BACT|nr:PQQ-binding-like beta-propeller repeat protein [Pseudobythopirellula maris]TWT86881.1 outer membrane biogenesis protein BamB [Pseudobythopirellula maris]